VIYLDQAATAPVRREVLEAMWPYLTGEFGNPSSVHGLGTSAATALNLARESVAAVLNTRASDVVFTSGGTEADNMGIKGISLGTPRGRHIVTTAIEHEAVLASCDYLARFHGFEVTVVGVDVDGVVDLDEVTDRIRDDTTLVAAMYANNEVGAIQPIEHLAAMTSARGVPLHVDAVQAAGWLSLDTRALGVTSLALSGHKIGAPKGTGVLAVRGGIPLEPTIHGGGQERGRRSGTENVAGAVGFATALELAERERHDASARISAVRDRFIDRVLSTVPGATLTGPRESRLPNSASFTFGNVSGESLLVELERHDILCSSGAACAAGRDEPSHVLLAMGRSADIALTAVRFSLTATTTDAELNRVAEALLDLRRTKVSR
jgi:cysteine desulfurase